MSTRFVIQIFVHFILCAILSGCSLPRVIVLKDPLSPEEHLNLGVAYERQGNLEAAIREYELAAPGIPRAYLYLGNSYFQKKDWRKAEAYYRRAIQEEPGNADAFNNLAWLYYTIAENLEEAEELARQAIELNPEKAEIYRDTLEKIRLLRQGSKS